MRDQLKANVLKYWCTGWGIDPGEMVGPGRWILPVERFRGSDQVSLYHLQDGSGGTAVVVDPDLLAKVEGWLATRPANEPVVAQDYVDHFGSDQVRFSTTAIAYLDETTFSPVTVDDKYTVRLLEKEDLALLDDLKNYCTEKEVYEGYVEIDDPVVYGCFDEERLVAVGSYLFWGDTIGDLGVLTHPAYRGQGLGKAVISALSQWGFANGKFPQYRNDIRNQNSGRLSQAMGFEPLFVEEEIIFENSQE